MASSTSNASDAAASILDKAESALSDAYLAEGGFSASAASSPAAIDPTLLSLLLDLGLKVLSACLASGGGLGGILGGLLGGGGGSSGKPSTTGFQVVASAKQSSLATQFVVRRAVRQELRDRYGLGGYARYNGDRLVAAILRAGANAAPADMDQLIAAVGVGGE